MFSYDESTGVFTRIKQTGPNALVGNIAGNLDSSTGYWVIKINGKKYYAHRLACLYMHGEYPVNNVDHINGNRSDNRIVNLREATNSQNLQNIKKESSNNKCGFLGVSKCYRKFRAQIVVNGIKKHLGLFHTPEDAYSAYVAAKRKSHEFNTL